MAEQVGEVGLRIKVGTEPNKWIKNAQGADDMSEYVTELNIIEGIDVPAIRATLTMLDSGDFISTLSGGEFWQLNITTPQFSHSYNMQCYKISDLARQEKQSIYNIELISAEFVNNEITNVFGTFKDKKPEEYVKTFLQGDNKQKYLASGKKLFHENAKDVKLRFVAPNWRPLNAINFVCEKSIRNSKTGSLDQGGYIFYENIFGFYFCSIDDMIKRVKEQKDSQKTQTGGGGTNFPKPRLYRYRYAQKNLDDKYKGVDYSLINRVAYPKNYNMLEAIRHGNYASKAMAFDPVQLVNGRLPTSKSQDIIKQPLDITIEKSWKDMEHLEKEMPISPSLLKAHKQAMTPRRTRLKPIICDLNAQYSKSVGSNNNKTDSKDSNKSMMEAATKAANYGYLRLQALKLIQLQITVPGNMDLYAGHGVYVEIPKVIPNKDKVELDLRYSGLYLIAGVHHKYSGGQLSTNLYLLRDSIKSTK